MNTVAVAYNPSLSDDNVLYLSNKQASTAISPVVIRSYYW